MRRLLRWLVPGLNVKRWLALFVTGVFLMGAGASLFLSGDIYARVEDFIRKSVYNNPLSATSHRPLAVALGLLGLLMSYYGMVRLVRSVLEALLPPQGRATAGSYYRQRSLLRGPKVVAIGGGTGLPVLLRGMKNFTSNITAVVTVADDGGSSGRLRTEFGILPPGDIRNCLLALADTESLMEQLFQYRFRQGEGLQGHSFGNLFILALSEITGDFEEAIRASSEVLAVRGQVVPSTLDSVALKAELKDGRVVQGESSIGRSSDIRRVFLEPANVAPMKAALEAIAEADLIVLGPGSLYTSVIPNLLVPGVADAIRRSPAPKVYICNIMTQPGETDAHTASRHVKAIVDHAGFGVVDYCLVNSAPVPERLRQRYREKGSVPVEVDAQALHRLGVSVVRADLLDAGDFLRHDTTKLSDAIGRLILDTQVGPRSAPWDYYLLRRRLKRPVEREQA